MNNYIVESGTKNLMVLAASKEMAVYKFLEHYHEEFLGPLVSVTEEGEEDMIYSTQQYLFQAGLWLSFVEANKHRFEQNSTDYEVKEKDKLF